MEQVQCDWRQDLCIFKQCVVYSSDLPCATILLLIICNFLPHREAINSMHNCVLHLDQYFHFIMAVSSYFIICHY